MNIKNVILFQCDLWLLSFSGWCFNVGSVIYNCSVKHKSNLIEFIVANISFGERDSKEKLWIKNEPLFFFFCNVYRNVSGSELRTSKKKKKCLKQQYCLFWNCIVRVFRAVAIDRRSINKLYTINKLEFIERKKKN